MNAFDQFIKSTAEKTGLPEALVQKVAGYQWNTTKKASLFASTIEITGMGRFQIRPAKLIAAKRKFERLREAAARELESLDKEDPRWYAAYKTLGGIEKDIAFLNMKKIPPKPEKNENRTKKNPGGDIQHNSSEG